MIVAFVAFDTVCVNSLCVALLDAVSLTSVSSKVSAHALIVILTNTIPSPD